MGLRKLFSSRSELDPLEGYALWAERYPHSADNPLMVTEEAAMRALMPDLAGRDVLDAACGNGRYARIAAPTARSVVGVDASPHMLQHARGDGVRFVRGDLCALPFPDASFDVVLCGLALGHVDGLALALAELARVLRPGGVLLYSQVHPRGGPAGWTRDFEDRSGRRHAIRWVAHDIESHHRALTAAGLMLDDLREPVGPSADGPAPLALVVRAHH